MAKTVDYVEELEVGFPYVGFFSFVFSDFFSLLEFSLSVPFHYAHMVMLREA